MVFNLILGFGGNAICTIEETKSIYEMLKLLHTLEYNISSIKFFIDDCIIEFFDLLLHLDDSLEEYMKEKKTCNICIIVSNSTKRLSTCLAKIFRQCSTSRDLIDMIRRDITIIFNNFKYDITTSEINDTVEFDVSRLLSLVNYINNTKLRHENCNNPHCEDNYNINKFTHRIYNLPNGLEILKKLMIFFNDLYLYVPDNIKMSDDEELFMLFWDNGGNIYQPLKKFLNNKKISLKLIEFDSRNFEILSDELRDCQEVVLKAVAMDGSNLEFAGDNCKNNIEVVRCATKQDIFSIEYASDEIKRNENFMSEIVDKNGMCLEYASEELKHIKRIVQKAVKNTGFALIYANEIYRDDPKTVKIATENNTQAIRYASHRILSNKDIMNYILGCSYEEIDQQITDENIEKIIKEINKMYHCYALHYKFQDPSSYNVIMYRSEKYNRLYKFYTSMETYSYCNKEIIYFSYNPNIYQYNYSDETKYFVELFKKYNDTYDIIYIFYISPLITKDMNKEPNEILFDRKIDKLILNEFNKILKASRNPVFDFSEFDSSKYNFSKEIEDRIIYWKDMTAKFIQ